MKVFQLIIAAGLVLLSHNQAPGQVVEQKQTETQQPSDVDQAKTPRESNGRRGREGRRRRGGPGGPNMSKMLFERFDTDQNGSISLTEAPEKMQQRFEQLDANGDQSISVKEFQAAAARKHGPRSENGKPETGGQKGKRGSKAEGRRQRDPAKLFATVDKNKDGSISLDEAPERMKQRFKEIDTDNSGTVTIAELKAAHTKTKERGGAGSAKKRGKGKPRSQKRGKGGKRGETDGRPSTTQPQRPQTGDELP